MKTYEVMLTKSYKVTVKAEDKNSAKNFAEFYTGDIANISTPTEQKKHQFTIENIDCQTNEAFDVNEIT